MTARHRAHPWWQIHLPKDTYDLKSIRPTLSKATSAHLSSGAEEVLWKNVEYMPVKCKAVFDLPESTFHHSFHESKPEILRVIGGSACPNFPILLSSLRAEPPS
ncbi:hypothetical protein I7I51_01775 [Histoplasma capsulatum]|uniref:Uncharacterized protein n=1 Tax=Ajellomyces capsulatus TaxID=5037 RepID=A0A8A1MJD5_AJECA|nr:hypothetical protein I7I51_01775 [Histoplasma capsulatum]